MDALSTAASLIALKLSGSAILLSGYRKSKYSGAKYLEFKIFVDVLDDISQIPLSSLDATTTAVQPCIVLCQTRLHFLESLLSRSGAESLGSKEGEKAVVEFIRSVKILRDIVMDDATHNLLKEQRHLSHLYMDEIRSLKASTETLFSLVEQGLSHNTEQSRIGLQSLAEKLQSMKASETSNTTEWRPDHTDPFSFSATILQAYKHDSEHTVARGKLDTGCDQNWISMEVLERAGLRKSIDPIESTQSYIAFGGGEFEPIGKVDIDWYATNASKSNRTSFLVHHDVPFDMVLGRIWIAEESIFVFNKPVLALRMGNFTREEHRIIEETARNKGATNKQLVTIRRAEEASARDRLRQQKAASIASTRSPSPTDQSTLSLVSSRTLDPVSGQHPRQPTSQLGRLSSSSSTLSTQHD